MSLTRELLHWSHEQKCQKTVDASRQNGFTAVYCDTPQHAHTYILEHATDATSIGFGGSRTIVDLDVEAPLTAQGKEILNHANPALAPEEKLAAMRCQLTCDLFLTSTNALTQSGWLVNIDGNGNRVAAMLFGPRKVIVVAGRNKLVEGDLESAIHRIKTVAGPANAKRLNRNTPCAKTGTCADCNSPERICRVTSIIDRKPSYTDVHVLVVNQDLGL
jgi:LUD domain